MTWNFWVDSDFRYGMQQSLEPNMRLSKNYWMNELMENIFSINILKFARSIFGFRYAILFHNYAILFHIKIWVIMAKKLTLFLYNRPTWNLKNVLTMPKYQGNCFSKSKSVDVSFNLRCLVMHNSWHTILLLGWYLGTYGRIGT